MCANSDVVKESFIQRHKKNKNSRTRGNLKKSIEGTMDTNDKKKETETLKNK